MEGSDLPAKGWTYRPRNPILTDIFADPSPNLLGEHLFFHKRHCLDSKWPHLPQATTFIRIVSSRILIGSSNQMVVQPPVLASPSVCRTTCGISTTLSTRFRPRGVGSVKTPIKSCELFQPTVSLLCFVETGVRNTLKWYDMIWNDMKWYGMMINLVC